MRASIAVSEAPEETVELVPRMFQLTQHSPREDMGCPVDFRFRSEQQGLCSPAKVDPHEGHLRPEMVALVPPAPRRGVQSAKAKPLLHYSADRSRRSPFHEV